MCCAFQSTQANTKCSLPRHILVCVHLFHSFAEVDKGGHKPLPAWEYDNRGRERETRSLFCRPAERKRTRNIKIKKEKKKETLWVCLDVLVRWANNSQEKK
jgi:hypothetical protein